MASMMEIDQQALAQPDQVEQAPAQPDHVEQAPVQPDHVEDVQIETDQYAHVDSDTLSLPGPDADFKPVFAELRKDVEDEDDYGKNPKQDGDENAWEYCFFHADMAWKLNSLEKGQRATMYHSTFQPNWNKLAKKQNVWINVRGVGNSSYQYRFKSSHFIMNPGQCTQSEYLWYESTSGKVTDLLFRMVPGPIIVTWNFTSCEERKLCAIEFFYAFSGNKITCIVRKMGTKMTVKKLMEELTIHMTFSNQASRFQVYKPMDPVKYKQNTMIVLK